MRASITIIFSVVFLSSVVLAQEGMTSKDADQLFQQVHENKVQIKKWMLLHQEGAFFLHKLKSIGALSGIPRNSHGSLKSDEIEDRSLDEFGPLFPFEGKYILTVDGDKENEYQYMVNKSTKNTQWQLKKAIKRNTTTKDQFSLPLPSTKLQSEANILLKQEDSHNGN